MKTPTREVSYIDWEDSQGNCGTSYAIILEADSREEAERELVELKGAHIMKDNQAR